MDEERERLRTAIETYKRTIAKIEQGREARREEMLRDLQALLRACEQSLADLEAKHPES